MSTPSTADPAEINRQAYATRQSRREYSKASGYLDAGERMAFDTVLERKPSAEILDIGIGGGRTTELLSQAGTRYVGIDYVRELVDAARKRHPRVHLTQMDARKLNFDNDSFDLVVFSYNGLDSVGLDDRAEILAEVQRVLRPGGVFLFSSLNLHGPSFPQPVRAPISIDTSTVRGLVLGCARTARWWTMAAWIGLPTLRKVRRMNRGLEQGETVLRQTSAHYFGVVLLYSSVAANLRLLERAGLTLTTVMDQSGHALPHDATAPDSHWLYYVARK
jgi:ubiquinone/menaquinone biosynthesis C-methylase UbiE